MGKRYTDEFKRSAVKRLNAGEPPQDICKDLKIHNSSLYGWRQKFGESKQNAPERDGAAKANGSTRDAILYLKHARRAMLKRVAAGKDAFEDPVYLYAMLALNTLEGNS